MGINRYKENENLLARVAVMGGPSNGILRRWACALAERNIGEQAREKAERTSSPQPSPPSAGGEGSFPLPMRRGRRRCQAEFELGVRDRLGQVCGPLRQSLRQWKVLGWS